MCDTPTDPIAAAEAAAKKPFSLPFWAFVAALVAANLAGAIFRV